MALDFDKGFIGGFALLEGGPTRGAKTVFCSSFMASSNAAPFPTLFRTVLILFIAMRYRLCSFPYSFSSICKMRPNICFKDAKHEN